MGTSQNYLRARHHVDIALVRDSLHAARRSSSRRFDGSILQSNGAPASLVADLPRRAPSRGVSVPPLLEGEQRDNFNRLLKSLRDDPNNPLNWQRRMVNEELVKPRVAKTYLAIRRSLWEWEEFAAVRIGARTILETVIELARSEAFPWYVAVAAQDVRRVARLAEGSYARSVRELETLAITRPARLVRIANNDGMAEFPGKVNEREELKPIAQWVIRYRRGIPWNKHRAAWWINYDLLCGTGRVLPGFVVSPRTLNKTYGGRNQRMGREPGNWVMKKRGESGAGGEADDAFLALEEGLTRSGPLPPMGLRAALWQHSESPKSK